MRYFTPLVLPRPRAYLLTSYEALVTRGESELSRLFKFWGLELNAGICRQLIKPSSTITESSQVNKGADPLSGWKTQLTDRQVENILLVLGIFGMTFYSEDLEPDYAALEEFSYSPCQ